MLLIQGKNSSNENIIKKKYNNKEMLDPDGSFHTKKKKKTLSNTWILTEVQSPIKAQIS